MWKSTVGWFRGIALLEGISYLVLLLIAMPLKYWADEPAYVTIVGMAHGVLFTLYLLFLLLSWIKKRWSFLWVLLCFIIAFVPFATFWLEAKLRKEQ
ncbi:DUF3817 domain-containing protein [Paenibacillus radicis (ex Gao et al. 2016)]|uniref:Membrane protein n=1 Tax=Paenibacillus radicis (ex Gao et al. 2016) TaxID=1737354 RepID=A0A917HPL5_9BACL|nr:DUF3817 domain-containing protein [Paenibacillus radicis (ex Gao et al. 2016)]GGG86433.1 membrane protein [Paenibacillus radicis (ex Gao et al. 2016)]